MSYFSDDWVDQFVAKQAIEPTVLTAALRRKAEILKMDLKRGGQNSTQAQRCEEMISIIDSLDAVLARAL